MEIQTKQSAKSRYRVAKNCLIFWTLFIGIGAVAGACSMLIDPTGKAMGMDAMLPYFEKLPFSGILFSDFVFSGIALLIVNGLTNLTAAVLLLCGRRSGVFLGGLFGVTLMLWICIQFYIFPFNFMSTSYFVFGLCQAATGYTAWIFGKQEAFRTNPADYPDVGKDPRRLVVYFSRMGYGKRQAYEIADRTGADVYEIRATERTEGTLGFWWCGRFGMHRWEMPIDPISVDLSRYSHVTVVSPIWVFSLAGPVRRFCREAAGRIREVDYVLLHHTGARYESAAEEMDRLLGLSHTALTSLCCRCGKCREVKGKKIVMTGHGSGA